MRDRNKVGERERVREREWESEIMRVRKPLRTAKEPALVSTLRRKLLGGFKMFLNMPILTMGHVWSKENLK